MFDTVKKNCQNNNIPCLIYIDGLDDAKGQEISGANCGLFNSSKKEKKSLILYFTMVSKKWLNGKNRIILIYWMGTISND